MLRKYPFYLKSTVILFGLILLTYVLCTLREILVPLAFSLLLAMLLNPLVNFLVQKKVPKIPAIVLAMFVAFILLSGLCYFLTMQIASFTDELPLLKQKSTQLLGEARQALNDNFKIDMQKQEQWLDEAKASAKPIIGHTLGTLMGSLFTLFLLPVYTFLFIFYKTLLVNFLYEIFAEEKLKEVNVVLSQTKKAIQNYMFGLMIEAIIVAILNSVALMILGVQYAILIGVIGAVLNVLPYIGGITAVALPVVIATITKDGFQTQIWIIVAYMVIQFIDNHFLIPYVVSSRVKINALVSIVIVLMGGALWGISGMFLSIPIIGVLKIIFDRIPEMKPWGKLLGDEIPTRHKGQLLQSRKRKVTPVKENAA